MRASYPTSFKYSRIASAALAPSLAATVTAAVYTRTMDVEIEINGYLTYDRQMEKMDAKLLRRAHLALISS